jgi:hypothetical protein
VHQLFFILFLYNKLGLLSSIFGTTLEERLLRVAVEALLDWQWNDFLSKQVPRAYLDELYGAGVGGFDGKTQHDIIYHFKHNHQLIT